MAVRSWKKKEQPTAQATPPEPISPKADPRQEGLSTDWVTLFPKSRIRLSGGRTELSDELQAMAFFAGANSLFTGDRLLTTPNPGDSHDHQLMAALGMRVEGSPVTA